MTQHKGGGLAVAAVPQRPRRPGRPPQTIEEQARARENILQATGDVFAELGYHGMKVALILERAGIARPTFYRYFRNADEALEIVLARVGAEMLQLVRAAIAGVDEVHQRELVYAAIDAYLDWSRERRGLLRALYAGVDDPVNPVSAWRRTATEAFIELIQTEMRRAGRPPAARWVVETYLNAVEFTAYRLSGEAAEEGGVEAARVALRRVALGLLGSREDWVDALDRGALFPPSWPASAATP